MEGKNKETKITSVEKEGAKDPRRVEQGKKPAAISREAKERKARERQQRETESKSESFSRPYTLIISAIGVTLGGYYLYHLYRPGEKEEMEEPPKEEDRREEPKNTSQD